MAKTLAELAAEANGYLRRDYERDIVLPVDGAPEWFTALCRYAHSDMGPDDWRYEFIQDALTAIENDDSEENGPDVDSLYPYTADRLRWIGSRLDRTAFCDQAIKEYGFRFTTTDELIAVGMFVELSEVFRLVRQFLSERVEAEE